MNNLDIKPESLKIIVKEIKYVVKKTRPKNAGRYESGHKRCSLCEIYIIWDGDRCPCCGCKLRKKPRTVEARNKLVQTIN